MSTSISVAASTMIWFPVIWNIGLIIPKTESSIVYYKGKVQVGGETIQSVVPSTKGSCVIS